MRCAKKDRALAGTSVNPRKDSRRMPHLVRRFSQCERGRTPQSLLERPDDRQPLSQPQRWRRRIRLKTNSRKSPEKLKTPCRLVAPAGARAPACCGLGRIHPHRRTLKRTDTGSLARDCVRVGGRARLRRSCGLAKPYAHNGGGRAWLPNGLVQG